MGGHRAPDTSPGPAHDRARRRLASPDRRRDLAARVAVRREHEADASLSANDLEGGPDSTVPLGDEVEDLGRVGHDNIALQVTGFATRDRGVPRVGDDQVQDDPVEPAAWVVRVATGP